MLYISNIRIEVRADGRENLLKKTASVLSCRPEDIKDIKIIKKSIDARKKNNILFIYSVIAEVDKKTEAAALKKGSSDIKIYKPEGYIPPQAKKSDVHPIVCGMGPAGLFCALMLARAGLKPIVLERGADVDARTEITENFFASGKLDERTNVQFGEGGAGTFSDGKLTTGINDVRIRYVLDELISHGAPEEIGYFAMPHIGTDILKNVVKNIRKEIISLGGMVHFQTMLVDIITKDGAVCEVLAEKDGEICSFDCSRLILAIGHSARDTFELIHSKGFNMIQKPFAVGVRAEHKQSLINRIQYGDYAEDVNLGAATYKLNCKLKNGRGVYSFCMCPGGIVVAAASEKERLVVNGMSYHARNGKNSNAALLCDVRPDDFSSDHPLAGMHFQQKWESAAYKAGGGAYRAPALRMEDFLRGSISQSWGEVEPTYKPGVTFAPIWECLPGFVCESLREGILEFDKKMKGYNCPDAVITGVETRSSSPVRILRDEKYVSNIAGVYPCGEGAGYAGGIMSAAVDGIKVSEAVIQSI